MSTESTPNPPSPRVPEDFSSADPAPLPVGGPGYAPGYAPGAGPLDELDLSEHPTPGERRPRTLEDAKDIRDESSPGDPVAALLRLEAIITDIAPPASGLSVAVFVTDGTAPGTGLVVSLRTGRYRDTDDEPDPDATDAARERQTIRDAIAEHRIDAVHLGADEIEALTDDIVAALAGE